MSHDVPRQVFVSVSRWIAITPLISLAAIGASFIALDLSRFMFLAIPLAQLSHRLADHGWKQSVDADKASDV